MRITIALAVSCLICGCSSTGSPTSSAPASQQTTSQPATVSSKPQVQPAEVAEADRPSAAPESAAPASPEPKPKQPEPTREVSAKALSTPAPRKLTETERIEALIHHVETLKNAVFIRNGEEHDCTAAAKHMRDKWNWKKKEIHTAEDFIRVAATKSSMSGEVYRIQFKDGHEEQCGEYLKKALKRLTDSTGRP